HSPRPHRYGWRDEHRRQETTAMERIRKPFVSLIFIAAAMLPRPARAETLFIPWVGVNSGAPNTSGAAEFGGSIGATAGGVIGAALEVGYSPRFFGAAFNAYVVTTMANVTVSLPFDRAATRGIRPYLTGGIGLIRARIDSARFDYSLTRNDVGTSIGGGI